MTILKANFLSIADSIAAQSQELAKEMGTGIEATTASLGAQNNIDEIMTPLAEDVVEDLLEAFRDKLNKVVTYPNAYSPHEVALKALNRHVGGSNAYLTAQAERVAPEFKWAIELLAIESLDPANTFSVVVDPMDTCTITGANAATWVDIADIDTDQYYASNLVVEKTTVAAGTDAITINLTCTKWDGTTEAKAVAVDASDAIGTKDDIGVHGTDMYTGVTLDTIVCAIGSIGEAWKVISELERTVAL